MSGNLWTLEADGRWTLERCCAFCGGLFRTHRRHAQFCGAACRQSASRARRRVHGVRFRSTTAKRANPDLTWLQRADATDRLRRGE